MFKKKPESHFSMVDGKMQAQQTRKVGDRIRP